MYVCMDACMVAYVYEYVCLYMCLHMYINLYMQIHVYVYVPACGGNRLMSDIFSITFNFNFCASSLLMKLEFQICVV